MFCPNCGNQLADDAKFCTDCGNQLGDSAPAATPAPPATPAVPAPAAPVVQKAPPASLQYEIKGQVHQTVEIELPAGERVFSETGAMIWMDENIEMETSIQKGGENKGALGNLLGAASRALQGESLFLNYFKAVGTSGTVSFASSFPGKLMSFNLASGQSIVAQRGSFLVGQEDVDLKMEWRGAGAGLFGGEGLILQRLTGPGLVFVEIDGELSEVDLAPGRKLIIDTGHIACFEETVSYNIEFQKGIKNILAGGEGLFLATLTGPGKVWLQHMTMPGLAGRLIPFLPQPKS